MTIKTYAAIATGSLAMLVTALLLWSGTQMQVQDICAVALLAYYAGLFITFVVTDWKDRKGKRRRMDYDGPTIVTLDPEEWEKGKEAEQ